MNNKNKLIIILNKLGYQVDTDTDLNAFMRRKATTLYNTQATFKKFLDAETDYLPTATEILVRVRWKYYVQGYTEPKPCMVCGGPIIQNLKHKYCCHDCSTKVSTGTKRGPKVDLVALEKELRKQLKLKAPEFTLYEFGHKRSKFQHTCGRIIERESYRLLNNPRCECQHIRIMVHTLDTLRAKYKETNWKPIRKIEGRLVKFKNKECGHYQVFSFDSKNPVCCTCHKKYASNIVTHEEYIEKLKLSNPEYVVVSGKYKNIHTSLTYKHLICGSKFSISPEAFSRRQDKCPTCARKSRSSLQPYTIEGKTFYVRGKEGQALNWIIRNTNIQAVDIKNDFEKEVPKFRYRSGSRTRTYVPDFYIESKHIIVEVKDICTAGLGSNFFYNTPKTMWNTLRRKGKAVIAAEYRFNVMIFHGEELIKLPKNWIEMSYKEIRRWFTSTYEVSI
jgi:hypothetical protein